MTRKAGQTTPDRPPRRRQRRCRRVVSVDPGHGQTLDDFGGRVAERCSRRSSRWRMPRSAGPACRRKPDKAADGRARRSSSTQPRPGRISAWPRSRSHKKSRAEAVAELPAATKGDPLSLRPGRTWPSSISGQATPQRGRGLQADAASRADQPEAAGSKLQVLPHAGSPKVAREVADEGLKIDPNNAELYDLKSNACLFQSDFKCAVDALDQAYAVDSTKADTHASTKMGRGAPAAAAAGHGAAAGVVAARPQEVPRQRARSFSRLRRRPTC